MGGARRFQELVAWQLASELRRVILQLVTLPPISTDFELRDQLRDAARSITSNIAEGFGRRSHADFARFLDIAIGSLLELEDRLSEFALTPSLAPDVAAAGVLIKRTMVAVRRLAAYLRRTPTPRDA